MTYRTVFNQTLTELVIECGEDSIAARKFTDALRGLELKEGLLDEEVPTIDRSFPSWPAENFNYVSGQVRSTVLDFLEMEHK